ncbi:MAG: hypothetical protein M1839_003227 [Geoglossum umbratile]|nr:MAG: hypothetical protein M1839_003227 [Geoglossum umbratile]
MPSSPSITRANALSLPQFRTSYLPSLSAFQAANASYPISLHSAATLAPEDFHACFALIRDTSAEMYRRSAMGWRPGAKQREMRVEDMRYLVVKAPGSVEKVGDGGEGEGRAEGAGDVSVRGEGEPVVVGFLSFMLTVEDGYPVVYCYEIHLQPFMRGCGLGKHLMGLVEGVGRRVGVDKAMLTVFLKNKPGMKFYEQIGYTEDEFSPAPKRLRNGRMKRPGYVILSKVLK